MGERAQSLVEPLLDVPWSHPLRPVLRVIKFPVLAHGVYESTFRQGGPDGGVPRQPFVRLDARCDPDQVISNREGLCSSGLQVIGIVLAHSRPSGWRTLRARRTALTSRRSRLGGNIESRILI